MLDEGISFDDVVLDVWVTDFKSLARLDVALLYCAHCALTYCSFAPLLYMVHRREGPETIAISVSANGIPLSPDRFILSMIPSFLRQAFYTSSRANHVTHQQLHSTEEEAKHRIHKKFAGKTCHTSTAAFHRRGSKT